MTTYHAIVWLDHQEAHVIHFDREHIEAQKIKSRSVHKAGNTAGTDERFFHSIAGAVSNAQEILITGPAHAKDEFRAHCERHDKGVAQRIVAVLPSDHPSDGQLVAWARQYFHKYDAMQGQA
jgi:stalled ribosome rescue protein Dom34